MQKTTQFPGQTDQHHIATRAIHATGDEGKVIEIDVQNQLAEIREALMLIPDSTPHANLAQQSGERIGGFLLLQIAAEPFLLAQQLKVCIAMTTTTEIGAGGNHRQQHQIKQEQQQDRLQGLDALLGAADHHMLQWLAAGQLRVGDLQFDRPEQTSLQRLRRMELLTDDADRLIEGEALKAIHPAHEHQPPAALTFTPIRQHGLQAEQIRLTGHHTEENPRRRSGSNRKEIEELKPRCDRQRLDPALAGIELKSADQFPLFVE